MHLARSGSREALTSPYTSTLSRNAPAAFKPFQASRRRVAAAMDPKLLEALDLIRVEEGLSKRLDAGQQAVVNNLLLELEEKGRRQSPRPLDNALIFGNWNVAYTSVQNASKQRGEPAGGRFRSGLGRKIFRTEKLCQSILEPDLVTNKVEFSILGVLRGSVGLRGRLSEVGNGRDTVKVKFEPPRLSVGGIIDLPIGPKSAVQLTTTYLSEDVRLGKGSRGSLFVFTRGGPSDEAEMDKVGLGKTSALGWTILTGLFAAACYTTALLWRASNLWRISSVVPGLLAALITQTTLSDLYQRLRLQSAPLKDV